MVEGPNEGAISAQGKASVTKASPTKLGSSKLGSGVKAKPTTDDKNVNSITK